MMLDPFTYWSRVMTAWQRVGETGIQLVKTASASCDVVAARTGIIQSAMQSPMTANYDELSRMIPEKVAAFSEAGNVIVQAWWTAQADGLERASRVSVAGMTGQVMTPMDVVQFWSGASFDNLQTLEKGSRLGRDALAPVHRAATSNARRLKRSRAA